MSRSLIIGIVITLLLITTLASVFYYNYVKEKERALFDAIPNDAALVIEARNMHGNWQSLKASSLWIGMEQNETVVALTHQINYLDSILSRHPFFEDLLNNKKSAISFHKTNRIGLLFVAQAEVPDDWMEQMQQICTASGLIMLRHSFEKETVIDIADKERNAICSMTIKDKLLLCSTDGSLVEDAIMKLKYKIPNPVRRLDNLATLAKNGTDVNLYINYAELSGLISAFLRNEYADLFGYLRRFANWSILNIDIEKDNISMKGLTVTDDSLYQYLDLFNTQAPVASSLENYLPASTAYKIQLGFSDYPKFRNELTEYLQQIGKFDSYTKQKDSLESLYNIELDNAFENLIGEQVLAGCVESSSIDLMSNSFALIQTKDMAYAKTLLNGYRDKSRKRNASDSLAPTGQYDRLPFGNFMKFYFGGTFEHIESPYYAFAGDVVVFANSEKVLAQLISDIGSGNTLQHNAAYEAFRKSTGDTYNFSLFVNTSMAIQLPANFVNESFYSQLNRFGNDYKKFEFMQIQYASSNDNSFYTQITYKYNASHEEETRLLWQTKLDTTIASAPSIVFNSTNNQHCLLVQDVNNTLYYVSQSGAIVWRTKLSGKILSPVYEVDHDKNGSVCYLFNTATQTCLIDAAGNNVYGYPVRYPGRTNHPLFLTDLFGDSSYTWYVSLTNNRIGGYTLDGKPIKGWNPKVISAAPASPVNTFNLGMEKVLYTTDQNGNILLFNYTGEWIKTTLPVVLKGSPVFIQSGDTSKATVTGIDSSGVMFRIILKSDHTSSGMISLGKWNYHDINGTVYGPSNELYLLGADSFSFVLLNANGEVQHSKNVPDTLFISPYELTTPDGKLMTALIDKPKNKLYLYDSRGSLYPTFPLDGNTPFAIGSLIGDGSKNLVTGDNNNNLRVYRLK